jgi:hypothetical protein
MAQENLRWGYDRIQGAPANLGHLISNTCVVGILKARSPNLNPNLEYTNSNPRRAVQLLDA